jgi:hypothetical protein
MEEWYTTTPQPCPEHGPSPCTAWAVFSVHDPTAGSFRLKLEDFACVKFTLVQEEDVKLHTPPALSQKYALRLRGY